MADINYARLDWIIGYTIDGLGQYLDIFNSSDDEDEDDALKEMLWGWLKYTFIKTKQDLDTLEELYVTGPKKAFELKMLASAALTAFSTILNYRDQVEESTVSESYELDELHEDGFIELSDSGKIYLAYRENGYWLGSIDYDGLEEEYLIPDALGIALVDDDSQDNGIDEDLMKYFHEETYTETGYDEEEDEEWEEEHIIHVFDIDGLLRLTCSVPHGNIQIENPDHQIEGDLDEDEAANPPNEYRIINNNIARMIINKFSNDYEESVEVDVAFDVIDDKEYLDSEALFQEVYTLLSGSDRDAHLENLSLLLPEDMNQQEQAKHYIWRIVDNISTEVLRTYLDTMTEAAEPVTEDKDRDDHLNGMAFDKLWGAFVEDKILNPDALNDIAEHMMGLDIHNGPWFDQTAKSQIWDIVHMMGHQWVIEFVDESYEIDYQASQEESVQTESIIEDQEYVEAALQDFAEAIVEYAADHEYSWDMHDVWDYLSDAEGLTASYLQDRQATPEAYDEFVNAWFHSYLRVYRNNQR